MTVNLADYVGKCVIITLRDGSTEVGSVKYEKWQEFLYSINDQQYTKEGKWLDDRNDPMDIVKIEEYVPPTERYCESCAFWEDGYCQLPDTIQQFMEIVTRADDDSGLSVSLKTGPKFGCNQHKGVWE
jgi:hypothetical protein